MSYGEKRRLNYERKIIKVTTFCVVNCFETDIDKREENLEFVAWQARDKKTTFWTLFFFLSTQSWTILWPFAQGILCSRISIILDKFAKYPG